MFLYFYENRKTGELAKLFTFACVSKRTVILIVTNDETAKEINRGLCG